MGRLKEGKRGWEGEKDGRKEGRKVEKKERAFRFHILGKSTKLRYRRPEHQSLV